jgi:hypothetical protein
MARLHSNLQRFGPFRQQFISNRKNGVTQAIFIRRKYFYKKSLSKSEIDLAALSAARLCTVKLWPNSKTRMDTLKLSQELTSSLWSSCQKLTTATTKRCSNIRKLSVEPHLLWRMEVTTHDLKVLGLLEIILVELPVELQSRWGEKIVKSHPVCLTSQDFSSWIHVIVKEQMMANIV